MGTLSTLSIDVNVDSIPISISLWSQHGLDRDSDQDNFKGSLNCPDFFDCFKAVGVNFQDFLENKISEKGVKL